MATRKRLEEVKQLCLRDDAFLSRSIKDSAELYGLSDREMAYVRKLVRIDIGSKRGGVLELRQAESSKEVRRKIEIMIDANIRYPGIVQSIYEGGVMAAIGRRYGISRQRVEQFKKDINLLLNKKGEDYVRDFIYTELPKRTELTRRYAMVTYNRKIR